MFESILNNSGGTLSYSNALICIIASLILGIIISIVHMIKNKYTKDFIITLVILPLIVSLVIQMVNGNLGTSVAILGAFSLIRFRSIPANSREIIMVFFAMAIGLAVGMGHILYATCFTIITSIIIILLCNTKFGENRKQAIRLNITIPEDLNYNNVFNKILDEYTTYYKLIKVKTTNMGSLYDLTYSIMLKENNEKKLIDELRCRNGNLKIVLNYEADITYL